MQGIDLSAACFMGETLECMACPVGEPNLCFVLACTLNNDGVSSHLSWLVRHH